MFDSRDTLSHYRLIVEILINMPMLNSDSSTIQNCKNMAKLIKETHYDKSFGVNFALDIALYICDKYDIYNIYDHDYKIYFDTIAKCATILHPDGRFDVKKDDNYNYDYIIVYDDKRNFELDDEDEDNWITFEEIARE